MRSLLSLWLALALWLVPAAAERRAPASGVDTIAAVHERHVEPARLPERVTTSVRGTLPTLARAGAGAPAIAASARTLAAWTHVAHAFGRTLASTARRATPPRRLSFPVEAMAPPALVG